MKTEKTCEHIAEASKKYFELCKSRQDEMPMVKKGGELIKKPFTAKERLKVLRFVCDSYGLNFKFMRTLLRADQIRDYNEHKYDSHQRKGEAKPRNVKEISEIGRRKTRSFKRV
jgi:hypothetical protein